MRRILIVVGLTAAALVPAASASASIPQRHEICIVTYDTPDASGPSRDFCINW